MKFFSKETRRKISISKTKHGYLLNGKPKIYRLWEGIKSRTSNPKEKNAKYYVLRGITLCDEWKDFANFAQWAMANGYSEGLSIDRIDNDRGYSPDNCRFVTMTENVRNSRAVKINIETAARIKFLLNQGSTRAEVARIVGCTWDLVNEIFEGHTWRDVEASCSM